MKFIAAKNKNIMLIIPVAVNMKRYIPLLFLLNFLHLLVIYINRIILAIYSAVNQNYYKCYLYYIIVIRIPNEIADKDYNPNYTKYDVLLD